MNGFAALLRRDLKLAYRQASDSMTVLAFFVLATVLFPLAVGPEPAILARIGAGVVWVAALLAAMLSMDRMFQSDFDDGTLELLVIAPAPLELCVLAKAAAHWLTTGVPLIVAAPLMGLFLNLDTAGYATLLLALALGTPSLSLIGAVGAALVLGARRGGALLSLLILPLFVPVLIFGVGAVEAALTDVSARPHLLVLAAFTLAALALAPWPAAAALRQAVE
ncbi:MAG: ABC-type transport system involved in cytochrome c biosis, permease component [Rhodospirillales bacterium]|nr:ABC-type transport system involved in cytochrome c biosis, permease component [Rhodospirillales bacterium]